MTQSLDQVLEAPRRELGERRWESDYVLASSTSASRELWVAARDHAQSTLFVCGVGFDPRTLHVASEINDVLGDSVEMQALELPGGFDDVGVAGLAEQNRAALQGIFGTRATFVPPVGVTDANSAGALLTRTLVADYGLLERPHVVVDLSALPSAVSFPLLHMLLLQSTAGARPSFSGDLQVIVSENPDTDARIRPTGLDDPDTHAGFARLPDADSTRVWVPVLGEGRAEQLRAIREFLEPHEVCPVLPFPAIRARRADDLLIEHRQLLFDEVAFEPRNVLYASERNPFDLYRQLCALADRYRRALEPLGGASIVVSQHASKLLSLGVLLAAHEENLVVVHVRPTGYSLAAPEAIADAASIVQPVLHTAWLSGLPYEM